MQFGLFRDGIEILVVSEIPSLNLGLETLF